VGILLGVLAAYFIRPRPLALPTAPARARTTHYHYTENGMKDERWVYKEGRLFSHDIDRNLDGDFDYWAYYDNAGYVIRVEEDDNFDGKPDEFWRYSNGEITGMEKDTDFNGVPDEFYAYRFHLPVQEDIRPNGSRFTTTRILLSNGIVTEIWRGGDSNGNFREKIAYDHFFNPLQTNAEYFPLLPVSGH